jgi:hypothetical protein
MKFHFDSEYLFGRRLSASEPVTDFFIKVYRLVIRSAILGSFIDS